MEQDHISWVIPVKNFQEKQNSWKGGPVFAARKFQTEICVPYLQTIFRLNCGCFSVYETDLCKWYA